MKDFTLDEYLAQTKYDTLHPNTHIEIANLIKKCNLEVPDGLQEFINIYEECI